MGWLASHLSHEGYESTLKELQKNLTKRKPVRQEMSKEEIGSEWKRLQAFMMGKK